MSISKERKAQLSDFQKKYNLKFKNIELLNQAFIHTSFTNESNLDVLGSYERLEFLGDAVLELCMSKYLFSVIDLDEGVLTKSRAKAVCEDALNVYAKVINLSQFLYLGKGEECSGGRERPAIIADAFEAVLGAVFLDGGINEAYRIVEKFILPNMGEVLVYKDYKSILQEKLQSEKRSIRYEIVKEEGPANNKKFEAVVYMDEIIMGRGVGKSKKEAAKERN